VSGAVAMAVVLAIIVVSMVVLIHATIRSIRNNRNRDRSIWREFSLSLIFMILFFASWIGQAIAQFQEFTDEALSHGQHPSIGDFVSSFSASTLENWQSEFLQLFSFVTLSALYIHKGSAESKDGDENIEASLRRIETAMGTLPPTAPTEPGETYRLPETPLEIEDELRRGAR